MEVASKCMVFINHHTVVQSSANSKGTKQSKEQALRAAAMQQYEEDRVRQRERAERERRLRGEAVAAVPLKDQSQDKSVRRPPAVAVTGGRGVRLSGPEGGGPDEAEEPPDENENEGVKDDPENDEDMDQDGDEEQEESEDDDAQADGLRRRFPGAANRLGSAEEASA